MKSESGEVITIVLISLAISLFSGVMIVEYQKARTDPPPFQSHIAEAPTFSGEIKITPSKRVDI